MSRGYRPELDGPRRSARGSALRGYRPRERVIAATVDVERESRVFEQLVLRFPRAGVDGVRDESVLVHPARDELLPLAVVRPAVVHAQGQPKARREQHTERPSERGL